MATSARRLLILVLPLLAGCATAARREVQVTAQTLQHAKAEQKACIRAAITKPEYAPLLPHTADLSTGQFSMAQLTDETVPTLGDARLLATRHDEVAPCRKQFLNAVANVRPDAASIIADEWASADQILARLIERKISWAEAFREDQALEVQTRDKGAVADREWRSELNAENQDELNRRQAAANALLRWSAQQQMINAAQRPVTTNCNRFGATVNCVSY